MSSKPFLPPEQATTDAIVATAIMPQTSFFSSFMLFPPDFLRGIIRPRRGIFLVFSAKSIKSLPIVPS